MSAPDSETTTLTQGSQAEASSSVQADTAPRRGSRTRKPTSKAASLDPIEITNEASVSAGAASRAGKRRKVDDLNAEQEVATDTDRINEEVDEVFDGADDEEEDDKEYCICRGKDDGTFMISCERCNEWYHTKCIGITQKAAKKLEEYICEACLQKDPKKKTASNPAKALKHYQSSKKRQATRDASDDQEEPERDEDDDASDGDEYVGERDGGSDAEDVTMEDDSTAAPSARLQRPKQSEPGTSSSSQAKVKSASSTETDKKARRKVSESMRRPSASSKPSSGPKKGSPRKAAGPSDASTEEARSRARKVLATALEKIFSSSSNNKTTIQTSEDTGKPKQGKDKDEDEEAVEEETGQQRAEAYAALLEEELFETNADLHGSIRIVGTKYKDRFRTFLFSLKDAKNTTLHSRIATGDLKASELAKMSNEELANDAIRQATEKARLEALHRSTLRAEEAGPMRKITHKGEIEIESDAFTREQLGKFQESSSTKDLASEKPPVARISESEAVASTSTKEREEDVSDPETGSPARRSVPAPAQIQGSPSGLNFGDVWNQSSETKPQEQDIGPQESYGFDVGSPQDETYHDDTTAAGDGAAADSGVDDFIDSFLDEPSGEDSKGAGQAVASAPSAPAERSTTPDSDPPSSAVHRYRNVLWKGLIDLPDIFAFQGHVKQVAGRSIATAPRVWPKFLPERPLLIAGRLPSKAAIDYLLQVVNAPRTEILAFTMEAGISKDGVRQATDSDVASFEGMMKHFKSADRWGALHVSSSVKGSLVKDFYVVPLFKNEEVPLWLDMADSDCLGADWHTKRDRDLLVLVAVVIRDALQAELSKAARQRSSTNEGTRQRQDSGTSTVATGGASDDVYDPTAVSMRLDGASSGLRGAPAAMPSGFGTDALQNLLRTLGKSAAPVTTLSTPTPTTTAAALSGVRSPFPGPPPPGPPPLPPPSFSGLAPPVPPSALGSGSPISGSWSPHPPPIPGGEEAPALQHWQQPHPSYTPQPYEYGGAPAGSTWGYEAGWNPASDAGMYPPPSAGPERSPPQPQELPEEECPEQYNPDFLAQASAGGTKGGGGRGYGQGRGGGKGRGGRGRSRGW
ncbi:hypothetical protein NDA18_001844 [Ustilago nuda]|nr:hypothetical protein NDA18_001844 [Ustilago nuda]